MVKETKEVKNKPASLKNRKKAQPNAIVYFSDAEKQTIKETVASTLDVPQFKIFLYTCQALGLNPLLNEICAVTYKTKDGQNRMSIQVMRDGFLTIAHRSGKFAGLESGVKVEPGIMTKDGVAKETSLVGWARVFVKGFEVPVYQEADFVEYKTERNPLWTSKPKTMIKKVAESMALRKAFNVNGVYSAEEMEKEIQVESASPKVLELADGGKPVTDEQIQTIKSMDSKFEIPKGFTKQDGAEKIQELLNKI